jgi:ABC-type microcin C transport system duplicated ATPase subunit YejF
MWFSSTGNSNNTRIYLHQRLKGRHAIRVKLPDPEIFDKYPHEISGGQKQRVMIAMAIACKPQLLIADDNRFRCNRSKKLSSC